MIAKCYQIVDDVAKSMKNITAVGKIIADVHTYFDNNVVFKCLADNKLEFAIH
jgi:hypothetical protein